MKNTFLSILIAAALIACNKRGNDHDASGTFETVETIVSAEANGIIKEISIEEGQNLEPGQLVGYIDSIQLQLRKKQLESQIAALLKKTPDINAQINAYRKQLAVAQTRLTAQMIEKNRIENLLKADAATPKQLDDITALTDALQKEIDVIKSKESAQLSIRQSQTNELVTETIPLKVQIEQINEQLENCRIINEIK